MAQRILVCFDEARSGPRVLAAAKRLSRQLKLPLVVVHVRTPDGGISGYYDGLFRDDLRRIEELFGGQSQQDLLFVREYFGGERQLPRIMAMNGDPAQVILRELASGDYALVVIGTKDGRETGAVGRAVIAGSPADVYVVKR
ncbi:MAG: universal stress protein [Candidatus Edwardsbacteria bacterium]|nr:universal stress protein [Candidatus Edwardsbacteria bacterium]